MIECLSVTRGLDVDCIEGTFMESWRLADGTLHVTWIKWPVGPLNPSTKAVDRMARKKHCAAEDGLDNEA
jgi:hypothetical protein